MNVNQLARNQQMMYSFINRGVSGSDRTQLSSQLSSLGNILMQDKDSGGDSISAMLQQMGLSGMQGRTVREIARYQVREQNTNGIPAKQTSGTNAASAAKQVQGAKTASDTKRKANAATAFSVRERYTPISEKATRDMQKQALEDAKKSVKKTVDYANGVDKKDEAAKKTDPIEERNERMREHLKEVDPSKRTAAYNTMNKVYENETDRLAGYIKEKTPGWNDWGDDFDVSILDKYKPGVNVFV